MELCPPHLPPPFLFLLVYIFIYSAIMYLYFIEYTASADSGKYSEAVHGNAGSANRRVRGVARSGKMLNLGRSRQIPEVLLTFYARLGVFVALALAHTHTREHERRHLHTCTLTPPCAWREAETEVEVEVRKQRQEPR